LLLLAIEPLHKLFQHAQGMGLLSRITNGCEKYRLSLYADGVAIFIKPTEHELKVSIDILKIFAGASGLETNMTKTEFYPIRCDNIDLSFLNSANLIISTVPCIYLGLPLHFRKPSKAMMEPLVQKIGNRLTGWEGNLLSFLGRELLVKSVISAIPTFFLTVFKM
jgi:hypothetical protein